MTVETGQRIAFLERRLTVLFEIMFWNKNHLFDGIGVSFTLTTEDAAETEACTTERVGRMGG